MVSFLDDLDDDQRAVVENANGIVRVLARAGSGKTRCLSARVEYLIKKRHVPYWRILVMTFSNRAADEVGARLSKVLGNKGVPRVGTFHSLAYEIVKEEFPDLKDYEIDDDSRYKTIVKEAMYGKRGINWPAADDRSVALHEVLAFIEYAKNFLLEPGSDECLKAAAEREYFKENSGKYDYAVLADAAYTRAEEIRHEKRLMSFDDMIFIAATTLRDDAKVREKWSKKFDYVLCDESQDTSQAQHLIAEAIAERRKNLMIVGDDFQCIPKGEPVLTPDGLRAIERIKPSDWVMTSANGELVTRRVRAVGESEHESALEFDLGSYGKFRATKNHVCFAALNAPQGAYVYLMFRPDMGFRIGVTRTIERDGISFKARTQQEKGERLWILEQHPSYSAGAEREAHLALQYQVPTLPFVQRPGIWADSEGTARIFAAFGANGEKLLQAYDLKFELPNYFAKASGRGRIAINVLVGATMQGRTRVEVETEHVTPARAAKLGLKPTDSGTFRDRRQFENFEEAKEHATFLRNELGGYIVESLSGTPDRRRTFAVEARSIHPGMLIPLLRKEGMVMAPVLARREVRVSTCYDLSIAGTPTFAVGSAQAIVHNSIYGWRFADREILSGKNFAGKTFMLPRNYRSGTAIVDVANKIFPGMKAMRTDEGSVSYIESWSFAEEAKAIVADIAEKIAHGTSPGSIAILYRCRWLSGLFEDLLRDKEIPFRTVGSMSFFERKESKDILAWMRVAVGSESNDDLKRTLLAPTLYLKRDAIAEAITRYRDEGFRWEPDTPKLRGWLGRLSEVKSRRSLSTAGLVSAIFKITGYEEFLKRDGEEDVFDARGDGIQRFADIAGRWDEPKDFLAFVKRASNPERKKDAVWLSTVYIAKGREWPHVYVVGLANGIFPHWRSVEEEEQRLFYVATTRAQDNLVLSGVEVFDPETNKVKYPMSPYFDRLRPIDEATK